MEGTSLRTGEYIVTEGTDATGKTTVANLLAMRAYKEGREVIRVDEPDSAYSYDPNIEKPEPLSPIASEIRRIIKDGSLGRVAMNNVHLFTASRIENWFNVVQPALERGAWVIAARNWFSTLAYQGYAEGTDPQLITDITAKSLGPAYMNPDFISILDLEDEVERKRRIDERGPLDTPDTFESRDKSFQQRIIDGYRIIAHEYAIPLTSADRNKYAIADDLWNQIQDKIKARDERSSNGPLFS
jgi:dTMP kinase